MLWTMFCRGGGLELEAQIVAGGGEMGGVQLGVGVEEGAGVGAPGVHLHTVCLPHPLEGLLQLRIS